MIYNQRKEIIFITKKDYSHILPKEIEGKSIIVQDNFDDLIGFIVGHVELGFDREFTSLNVLEAIPLLSQFGNEMKQFVVDDTTMNLKELGNILEDTLLIGHNIKIDYKISKLSGIFFRKVFDTMLAEQVIQKGAGFLVNLNDVSQRNLGILPLKKDERETFWHKNPDSLFTISQILYAAEDVEHAISLKNAQQVFIDRYDLHKDLYEIEFPYTTIVADAELAGFKLNEKKWKEIIEENENRVIDYKNELNAILRDLREEWPEFKALKIDRKVKKNKIYQSNLFGDASIITAPTKSIVNYSSSPQVQRIFELISLPVPTIKKKNANGIKEESNSIGIPALQQYQIDNPGNPFSEFIEVLIKYSQTEKLVTSFGERFLVEEYKREKGKVAKRGYKNNRTGKVYTIYKQCGTDTTRMASGDQGRRAKKTDPPPEVAYYNSHNVPKEKRYRNSFEADDEDHVIITLDLSGAELVIAASLSNDRKLIELLTKGDVHSALAEYSYNKIIEYIITHMKPYRQELELQELLKANYKKLNCTEEEAKKITKDRVKLALKDGKLVINKETANDIRDKFKNVNYSLVYGGGIERIRDLLNICKEYAQIVEKALKNYLPTLFKYLDKNAKFGVENGYIRFNDICGGRFWFKEVIQAKRDRRDVPFWMRGEIERKCKNYPIQSTQGQMIKEATVKFFYEYVYPNNHEVVPKLWIHDEIVVQVRKDEAKKHAKVLQKYFNEVSSSYLVEGLNMESAYEILPYWTK